MWNEALGIKPTLVQYRVLAGYVAQKTLEKRQRALKVDKDSITL